MSNPKKSGKTFLRIVNDQKIGFGSPASRLVEISMTVFQYKNINKISAAIMRCIQVRIKTFDAQEPVIFFEGPI